MKCCTDLSEFDNNAQSPYGFFFCGLPPPRGSGITMDDCPNRGCSWVLREFLFPLRSRGSGGLPQPPGANTRFVLH